MINKRILAMFAIASMAACQGNFGSGTALPGTVGGPVSVPENGSLNSTSPLSPSSSPSAAPDSAKVFLADAPSGLQCPTVDGYTCVLSFNVPPTAAPPTPGPPSSPSPAATASPDIVSSAAATATPRSGPSMILSLAAQPTDAPPMVNHKPKAVATVALARVLLKPSADFQLNGLAIATFSLPAAQIPNRGFALQLFEKKKKKTEALYSLPSSELNKDKNSLTFRFTFRKITLPKGHTYVLVLYGDELPAASMSPTLELGPSSTP